MSATCPNGHESAATDYCDTCGAPMVASGSGNAASGAGNAASASADPAGAVAAPAPGAAASVCPNCGAPSAPDVLFCEACGYDFTTGAMPRSAAASGAPTASPGASAGTGTGVPPAIPLEWVAEVWVDPQWYADQEAVDPCPSPGLPVVVPLTVSSALIGRVSTSRNIHPDIDCATDSAVSRRHAQLTTDGTRWFVEDLQSSNGTFVGPASGPLPSDPIPVGPKTELKDGDRLYVGAWTRIVVRRATDEERAGVA